MLNRWAADDLAKQGVEIKPGDEVTLEYFEPESTHGIVKEKTAVFKLKGVLEMTPTVADRHWTPELPGVTDQKSIADWNPPFPYDDSRVRSRKPHDEDEAYWEQYKATPKAFISLAAGRKLWGGRFGKATSVRIDPKDEDAAAIESGLLESLDPVKLGFQFLPVKQIGLQAASGTTPFNVLFISFSFFIVASAVMLIALLFRLGVEQRASEIGLLMAVGLRWRKIARLLIAEGTVIAVAASLVGLAIGVGYAWLMLAGLTTWWLDAIRTPFLHLFVMPLTLLTGSLAGVIVALITIAWTLWRMRHIAVRRLLSGQATDDSINTVTAKRGKWSRRIGWSLIVVSMITAAFGGRLNGEAQAGAFFGTGALILTAMLTLLSERFRRGGESSFATIGKLALLRFAARNTTRNPRRSILTIGLIASASFLIVAIGAFRLDPTTEGHGKASGSGGFALIAESDQPIFQDLNTAEGRREVGFSAQENDTMKNALTIPLRVQPGDDASCLNLYQTTQPRAIGIPPAMIDRGGFAWAGSMAKTNEERENPWHLLDVNRADDGPIPVLLDANTATYSLHKGVGDILELTDGRGQPMKVRVVGLLKNSIFQGDLLMSESSFLHQFPEVNGYRMFLVDAPTGEVSKVQSVLESSLGDYGFDAETSTSRLANFFAVQNTYLSTFQSLGGLGLLLGTFGVAAVQLRSIFERRGELALLRACGFRQRRLIEMVMLENGALLLGGLLVGVFSASIAVLPHLFGGEASVPWQTLAVTLTLIATVGLIAGATAAWTALQQPLIPVLCGD